jgi:hypothetical protein
VADVVAEAEDVPAAVAAAEDAAAAHRRPRWADVVPRVVVPAEATKLTR